MPTPLIIDLTQINFMPASPENLIREPILQLAAYHVPPSDNMLKLDAMENPYRLPDSLQVAISKTIADIPLNRYPDPHAHQLKQRLREVMQIPSEMDILLGNGSDEIIQILAMAVAKPGAALLSIEPSFVMYKMIAAFVGLQYVGVPLNPDFSLNLEKTLAAIEQHQPAIIFLAYPNNPTGNLFDSAALLNIIRQAPGLVVIDEAYHAFADRSLMSALTDHKNLLVMRTISKLGLAGLRLGFLAGSPQWLTQLEKLRLPYNINSLTQAIADCVLQHSAILLEQAAAIKQERTRLQHDLGQFKEITLYPSDANFILFRIQNADTVFVKLKQHNILIKCLHHAHPMLENCLRLTVGTPAENTAVLNALRQILA